MIDEVSIRIDTFDALPEAIRAALDKNAAFRNNRRGGVKMFFDRPDGNAGKRAAGKIVELVPSLEL